jgi:hypothetical protein
MEAVESFKSTSVTALCGRDRFGFTGDRRIAAHVLYRMLGLLRGSCCAHESPILFWLSDLIPSRAAPPGTAGRLYPYIPRKVAVLSTKTADEPGKLSR